MSDDAALNSDGTEDTGRDTERRLRRKIEQLEAKYEAALNLLRLNEVEIERLEGALREIMRLDAGACLHIAEQALNKEQTGEYGTPYSKGGLA